MTTSEFQLVANTIPHQPGVYKYFDNNKELLYIGKAKDLRKRVASYFAKNTHGYKTRELVQRIAHITFTIVNTDADAFLLENALIKEYCPKYNILLKDDKTYPFIVIKKEPFPRIFLTRKKINDGSEYLGPFTSVSRVRELLQFIKQFIPLRTCKLNLSATNIQNKKFKYCLEYHLGNCKAPCVGFQTALDYATDIQSIKELLRGNLSNIIKHLKNKMHEDAVNFAFEKAYVLQKKIEALENYQAKSVIVSQHIENVDVFSILKEKNIAYVNYLMVQNGTIVQTHTVQVETKLDESDAEVLCFVITHLRTTFNSLANEVVVPFPIELGDGNTLITIPKAGDKKKLLDLSLKNVDYYKDIIRKKKILHLDDETKENKEGVLSTLQKALHLKDLPVHIECFDNSNFQGSHPVSAMVCFKMGVPSKNDYRKFNIKTVVGANDFATMYEVVFRRYKRLVSEKIPLPQLVVIDGGKGQLKAAIEAIQSLGLSGTMTVIGLAKNVEEIFFVGDTNSVKLDWNSSSLQLLRRIRDEVHRFGIGFHREKRSKAATHNELETIKGVGEKTATTLLRTFKSVQNIRARTKKEITQIVGESKANLIWAHLHEKK